MKPAWKQPEYYAFGLLCDGCVTKKHLTLARAKKERDLLLSNLFEPHKTIEIFNELTGEIL